MAVARVGWSSAAVIASVFLVCCAGQQDVDISQTLPGVFERIPDVEAFEKKILNSDDVWVVVFSSLSKDVNKIKGINREKCDEIFSQLLDVSIQLNSIHVKVGIADIDDMSGIASEFNVRKRMLPVALLFKTRARDADKLKTDLFPTPVELKAQVEEMLADNPHKEGRFQKITLTLGGGDL